MSGCGQGRKGHGKDGRATLRVKQEHIDNGGEEERDSKRPRTSTTDSNNVITGSGTTMMNDVAVPSSTTVASQSNAATATAVATSTASTIENNITSNNSNDNSKNGEESRSGNGGINNGNNSSNGDNVLTRLPIKKEVKKELYKLVDTDHCSRDASLQALYRLLQWNFNDSYDDILWFRDYFYNYAGLQIVLDFAEKFSNDAECVENATLVLQRMVRGIRNCFHSKSGEGTNIIFNHGGIEILLQSSSKLVEGNLNGPKLKALENIWGLFDTISYAIHADGTKIDTSSRSFKDRFCSIVNSCLDILAKLLSRDDRTSFDIMSIAFSILGNASKISTKMKDYVVIREIRNKGIISKTVEVFKMDDDSWNFRDNKLLRSVLCMLTDLNDNNLLTQASDFQSLLPLLVVAIKRFSRGFTIYIESSIITLLEKAVNTIEIKLIIEKAGVPGALVLLLETDDAPERMKKRVRNFVVKIICTR
jgi:hypothetical protein